VSVEITPVRSKREIKEFIELPFRLYRDQPMWVPPLRFERKEVLDRNKNPFFQHAEVEYFLARRNGKVVGRISAHVDHKFNEFQGNSWGLFGFFECEDDQEVADALLAAADGWLREGGRDRMTGPMSFTTNEEVGVLVDGFDLPPTILTDWTMPYYPRLLEQANLQKVIDLNMWSLYVDQRDSVHPAIFQMADEVKTKHGIDLRPMNPRKLDVEIPRFVEVYNEAWSRNWAFVPVTMQQAKHMAKSLRPILDRNWAFIAEKDGEVVGASLTLPDYNQVLKQMNGRLNPVSIAKALWYRRKINRVRVFALGVRKDYQHAGVAAKMYALHFDAAERTPQSWGETGWILETNIPMNRAMEGMGGKVIRTYRVYERLLEAGAVPERPQPFGG